MTAAAARAQLAPGGEAVVQILKTLHGGHGGKLSLVRVLRGSLKEGAVLHGDDGGEARIGGILSLSGDRQTKRNLAAEGRDVVLVSKDLPMRVKASAVGLTAEEYRAELVVESGWTGMTELDVPGTVVDLLCSPLHPMMSRSRLSVNTTVCC